MRNLIKVSFFCLAVACDGGTTGDDTSTDTDTDTDTTSTATCADFCTAALANCTDANVIYADDAACQTACAAFPTTGADGDAQGDTLQCRIYHAGAAGPDPATHCAHTAADGGGVCVD